MSKQVKLVVSIYLAIVLILCTGYLLMILIGSLQGNDMKGAVLDGGYLHDRELLNNSEASNTTHISPNSEELPNQEKPSNSVQMTDINHTVSHHTWPLDSNIQNGHVFFIS
ncbi:hypothetical protein [Staphylococcus sp. Marseille-Q5304]|uniref:hypothetical protein n=1 Tax=Staphylococcus sp. Marseille-Q5304 TaxID=2942200 RepID=UPI002073B957|nr:hypothetical protein [Staphylococcus sp. Marseille-Q5304]